MISPIISIKNLEITHKYKNKTIISVDNFDIYKGDIIFINGKNGSGKSTLIRTLFSEKDHPDYIILNKDYEYQNSFDGSKEDLVNKHITFLGQRDNIMSNMSIYKTILEPVKISIKNCTLEPYKSQRKQTLEKAENLVNDLLLTGPFDESHFFYELFDDKKFYKLEDEDAKREYVRKILKTKKSDSLSGGQTKLVAFLSRYVKVSIMYSAMLVLDEPLNNIDLNKIKRVSSLINDLIKKRDALNNPLSILIVSHLMAFEFIDNPNVKQYKIDLNSRRLIVDKIGVNHMQILEDL